MPLTTIFHRQNIISISKAVSKEEGTKGCLVLEKNFNIHSRGTQDRLFCFILLLPAIILCITFIIIPIIDSVWMSFTDYKIANLTQGIPGKWNNFANYTRLWDSGKLQISGRYYDFLCFCNSASYILFVSMTLAVDFKYKDRRSKYFCEVL